MFLTNVELSIFFLLTCQHSAFFFIGTCGNYYVLNRIGGKSEPFVGWFSLKSLVLLDMITCLVFLPVNYFYQMTILFMSSDFLCKIHSFLIIGTKTLSCELLVVLAIEFICSPRRKSLVRHLVFTSIIISATLSIYGFFSVGIEHQSNSFDYCIFHPIIFFKFVFAVVFTTIDSVSKKLNNSINEDHGIAVVSKAFLNKIGTGNTTFIPINGCFLSEKYFNVKLVFISS